MKLRMKLVAALGLVALAACGSAEERPFNEQFDSTAAELENKAAVLDREAANGVAAQEAELEQQARALREAGLDAGNNVAAAEQNGQ